MNDSAVIRDEFFRASRLSVSLFLLFSKHGTPERRSATVGNKYSVESKYLFAKAALTSQEWTLVICEFCSTVVSDHFDGLQFARLFEPLFSQNLFPFVLRTILYSNILFVSGTNSPMERAKTLFRVETKRADRAG